VLDNAVPAQPEPVLVLSWDGVVEAFTWTWDGPDPASWDLWYATHGQNYWMQDISTAGALRTANVSGGGYAGYDYKLVGRNADNSLATHYSAVIYAV
jgi:hypothetical protein